MTSRLLQRPDGHTIAWQGVAGRGPTIVWLGGFKSDMTGTKAAHLAAFAAAGGRAFVRFDYFGHGASSGAFADGTVSRWLSDALAVIDALTAGPLVLVGSSMGGWIATLAALARPERVHGLVAIAPALDFTERLLWAGLDEAARREITERGVWMRPSAYGDGPYPIGRALIEDGRTHLLLGGPIPLAVPVRILHGQADEDVPWTHGLAFADALAGRDVVFSLVKGGDHRLSTPADLARLESAVAELCDG